MTKKDQIITPEESRFGIQQFRNYQGAHTYVNNVKAGLESDVRGKRIQTLEELRMHMQKDNYFRPRHFRKVDHAIAHLKDEGVRFYP